MIEFQEALDSDEEGAEGSDNDMEGIKFDEDDEDVGKSILHSVAVYQEIGNASMASKHTR